MSRHPDVISGKITAKEAYQQFLSHFDTHSSSTRGNKVLSVSYAVSVLCVVTICMKRLIVIRIACRILRIITGLLVRRSMAMIISNL